ncbi:MAG TPA: hypothetical protein VFG30_04530 [Polyangiales bacterium]|nr:hypothetical protein [Polyangiales bacterium]
MEWKKVDQPIKERVTRTARAAASALACQASRRIVPVPAAAGDALDDVVAACVSASVGSLEAVMTVDQPERGGVVTLGSMGKLFVALRRRD